MATLVSYALTDVASVKESLGIDAGVTTQDNLIIRKINQATEMIEGYCSLAYGHHFASTTYTNEEYDGSGSNQLSLKMRPVTALTSFQRRNSSINADDWDDIESDIYFSDLNAGVIDLNFTQGTGWGGYRVTYTAGYTTIPADLAEACVMLAGYLVDNSSSGGSAVKKKQEGARAIEYFNPNEASSGSLIGQLGLDDMLARYKNYVLLEDK